MFIYRIFVVLKNINNLKSHIMNATEIAIRKQNSKFTEILDQGNRFGSIKFLVAEYNFENYVVKLTKSQWTKTQKSYGIRVDNFHTGKNHFIVLPADTLKEAKRLIQLGIETQEIYHWTGHVVKTGELISQTV